jgi:hypothetical protein
MQDVKKEAESFGKQFWDGRGLSNEEMAEKSAREGRTHAKIALEAGLRRTLKWSLWKEEGGADGRSGGKNAHLTPEDEYQMELEGSMKSADTEGGKTMELEQEWSPQIRQYWTLQTQRQAKAQEEVQAMQLNTTNSLGSAVSLSATSLRKSGTTGGTFLSQSMGALDATNGMEQPAAASGTPVLLSSLPKGVGLHDPSAPKESGDQLKGALYSLKSEWSIWGKNRAEEDEDVEDYERDGFDNGTTTKGGSKPGSLKLNKSKGKSTKRRGLKKLKKAKSHKGGPNLLTSLPKSPVSASSRKLPAGSAGGEVPDMDDAHKQRLRKGVDNTLLQSALISGTCHTIFLQMTRHRPAQTLAYSHIDLHMCTLSLSRAYSQALSRRPFAI